VPQLIANNKMVAATEATQNSLVDLNLSAISQDVRGRNGLVTSVRRFSKDASQSSDDYQGI
jgi:hypothetical protein